MKEIDNVFNWLKLAGTKAVPFNPAIQASQDTFNFWVSLIQEELDEAVQAFKEANLEDYKDAIADLFWVIHNSPVMFDIEDSYKEKLINVGKSNYTKFTQNKTIAEDTVLAYQLGKHPNKLGGSIDAYYQQVGNYFIIRRKSDNKILKSLQYKEPDEFKEL